MNFEREFGILCLRKKPGSTHASRTLMVSELEILLSSSDPRFSASDYRNAILEENVLAKGTVTTRRASFRYLAELYSLDSENVLFRALRRFQFVNETSLPLLALLVALTSDEFLKSGARYIENLGVDEQLDRNALREAISQRIKRPIKDSTLDKITRNCASSWTQSGHLKGRTFKSRQAVKPGPGALAMALLLGYLQGVRGAGLLSTFWMRILGLTPEAVPPLATNAVDLGLLTFQSAGDVVSVSFPSLLTAREKSLLNE